MALKNVSLTGGKPDYERDALKHQQALAIAQELLKQGLASGGKGTIDTGKYLVPDIGAAIGKLGQAYFGRQMQEEAQTGISSALAAKEDDRARSMNQFNSLRFGGQSTGNAPLEGQVGPPVEADTLTKPDPLKAVAFALSNRHPEVVKQGEELQKGFITPQELLKNSYHYNPAALGAAGAASGVVDPTKLEGAPKPMLSDGVVAGVTPGGNVVQRTPINQYAAPKVDPATGLPMQTEQLTGEARAMTGGNVTPERRKENQWIEEGITATIKELQASKPVAVEAARKLGTFMQIPDLIKAVDTGAAGDIKQFARRWGEVLKLPVDVDKISDYQSLVNAIGPSMLATLKQFGSGTGISDKDKETAAKMTLTDMVNDPNAMMRAQGIVLAQHLNTLFSHDKLVSEVAKWEGAAPFIGTYKVPTEFDKTLPDKYGLTLDERTGIWSAPISSTATKQGLPGGVPATGAARQLTPEQQRIRKQIGLP